MGLGNPGEKYGNTRHNLGFMVIDALAEVYGISLKKKSSMPCMKRA
jgi:peptidyl-tRNA hydrolase, PTH1 family